MIYVYIHVRENIYIYILAQGSKKYPNIEYVRFLHQELSVWFRVYLYIYICIYIERVSYV